MNNTQFDKYKDIPANKFAFAKSEGRLHDTKLDTKPVSYFKDAFRRFCKNKSSVVAAIIIMLLLLFALFVPLFSNYDVTFRDPYYKTILPSLESNRLNKLGIWDGCSTKTGNQAKYDSIDSIGYEWQYTNQNTVDHSAIVKVKKTQVESIEGTKKSIQDYYEMYVDSYFEVGYVFVNMSEEEYANLKKYQNDTNIQVIYPIQNNYLSVGANYWFVLSGDDQEKAAKAHAGKENYVAVSKATALRDEDGNYIPDYKTSVDQNYANYDSLRLDFGDSKYAEGNVCESSKAIRGNSNNTYPVLYASDGTRFVWYSDAAGYVAEDENHNYTIRPSHTGAVSVDSTWTYNGEVLQKKLLYYCYAVQNQTGYKVRVNYYEYFNYLNNYYPNFVFGTNSYGQDIYSCLAIGARLSFLLAICVCAVNFTIGTIYGAIEGYYGGTADIIMERISDILASVPFMVVATLFQLHLAQQAGPVLSLIFAFVLTGWIGMAGRVRMQFYRFKNQEYVLAARTLGANDKRIIWKHIFPNTLGTIITGSVLAIPGVIFSESMLSYLGIVDLQATSVTSIGTMLSQGNGLLRSFPHVIFFPALFISLLEISFNLFGNGLRDAFNPSLRGAED